MSNADNDEIIQHVQDTFCLDENDLHRMYEVFCRMAANGQQKDVANGPPSTDKSSTKKQRKKREKKKPASSPSPSSSSSNDITTSTPSKRRPWEANGNDSTASKEVTLSFSNFFTTFQPTQRCNNGGYMDAIFDLCGTKDLHAMTFPEFISSICTFATFKLNDMIKFIFFILDKQKAGCVSRVQLMRFVERIHVGKGGVRVFELAILPPSSHVLSSCNDDYAFTSSVAANKDISCIDNHQSMSMLSMNYNQFQTLVNEYPTIIEPLFLFQNKLRVYIMGENWWRRKEGLIKKRYLYSATHNDDDNDDDATQRQEPRRSWFRRLLYHLLRRRRREEGTQWRAGE